MPNGSEDDGHVNKRTQKKHKKMMQKSKEKNRNLQEIVQKSSQIGRKSDPGGEPEKQRKNIEKPTPLDSFSGTHFATISYKKPKKFSKKTLSKN